jgi:predicted TIM-barrel fold metal-dependent hydrolase
MVSVRVDVHTHLGQNGVHVCEPLAADELRAWGQRSWDVTPEAHLSAASEAERAIVLAFDAEPVGVVVPNEYVAATVAGNPRLIGFASVNPTRPDAPGLLTDAIENHGLRGLKLGPTYQHFHPHSKECLDLLEVADHYRIPVIWHQGTTFTPAAIAEYARPLQLDLPARRFPQLRMWIAHFGHPWADEAVSVVRRHEHFFIDASALDTRPWQLAQALATAFEYRVMDRILFGSDYPFSTIARTIAGLTRAAALCRDLGIAEVSQQHVEDICSRDSLALLGIAQPDAPAAPDTEDPSPAPEAIATKDVTR